MRLYIYDCISPELRLCSTLEGALLVEEECKERKSSRKRGTHRGKTGGKQLGVYWPPGMYHVLRWEGGCNGVGGRAEQTKMPGGWLNNTGFDE